MSFKPVRTFLESRLIEVDSDFEVHDDAFSFENIGNNDFNKRYHIFYGNVATSVDNQHTTNDVVNATVSLFFRGYRNATESLDESMDIANSYRLNCLKIAPLRDQQFIKRVVCSSIQAEPLDTNDNSIKITLQFSINVIFGTAVNLNC